MKKILSILSFVFFLNVNGQTNFIRPSITVFQTTSKNLDSVLFPGNLDRIYCANNKINFQSITSFDSIGYQKAKQELKKNNNLIFKTVFEELLIGNDRKLDMSKINRRAKNTMSKDQYDMSKSMSNVSTIDAKNRDELFKKNYAVIITENSYITNFSDNAYKGAHKLNATIYIVKLGSLQHVADKLRKGNNFIELNWSEISDSLLTTSLVSANNYELTLGPAAVPQGSTPLATAALEKTYAKLNKKFESYKEQDYINELYSLAVSAAFEKATRSVLDFQVVAPVKDDRPISSNIGSKEGLKIDNRYFVYEQVENEKGERTEEKVSTVRVRKVGDNSGISSDSSGYSKFYKIGGGNIEPGMYMRNKEDIGVGVSIGYGNDSWIRLDYRIKGITPGLKFFVDANPFPGKVELNRDALNSHVGGLYGGFLTPQNFYVAVSYKFSFGVEKTMHLGSRISLTPFVGIGKQAVNLSGNFAQFSYFGVPTSITLGFDTKEGAIWDGYLVKGGLRTGLHLSSALSLNASASFNSTLLGGYKDPLIVDQDGGPFGYFVGGLLGEEKSQSTLEQILGPILAKQPKTPNGLLWDISLRYEF